MNIRIMIHEFLQTKIVIRINSNNSKNTIFVIQMNRIFKIHANRFTIHHSNRSPTATTQINNRTFGIGMDNYAAFDFPL